MPGRTHRGLRQKVVHKAARVKRMLSGEFPDEFTAWIQPAVRAGLELARHQRLDAILSYCPPETNHVVAHHLAVRLGLPWVPFFADLYGFLASELPRHSLEGLYRNAWHRWCLAPAAECAAVSPAMVRYLASTYGKPVELVLNGFDPADFAGPVSAGTPGRRGMVISHVGSLYPGDQRPDILLDGLDRLIERQPEIVASLAVRFVGSKCDDWLRSALAGRPAARVCTVQPRVDAATAVSLVRQSDAILVFPCTAHRERYGTLSYPTKIFEALGARRPVLAVPADGDWVDWLLDRTGGGNSARDSEEVAVRLGEWFRAWKLDGQLPYHGKREQLAEFTVSRQVERLAGLLDRVASGR
jgi:glycosyltransferase involved in cell wall biosynthesis